MNIEEVLMGLADRILDIDEASMASLQEKYLKKVADFSASRDWERAIIVYFMISSVRVKNKIFNDRIKGNAPKDPIKPSKHLFKVIK